MIAQTLLVAILTLAACGPAPAQTPSIALSTTATDAAGRLAERYSAYGDNISPPLSWSPVAGARAYALIVEDPDAPRPTPFLHWLAWNIPGEADSLAQGITASVPPAGMVQGRNDTGSYGWFGPRPPAGSGPHHYHFQLFALDAPLTLGANAPLDAVRKALKAHTIAQGEMTATYEAR